MMGCALWESCESYFLFFILLPSFVIAAFTARRVFQTTPPATPKNLQKNLQIPVDLSRRFATFSTPFIRILDENAFAES
jgi:hypothetical protein